MIKPTKASAARSLSTTSELAEPAAVAADVVLEVEDLRVEYPVNRGLLGRFGKASLAVNGVSFSIAKGETLGLVGASGSGKTTIGRSIVRAVEPSGGTVTVYNDGVGVDVLSAPRGQLASVRRQMSMIYQNPQSSLNPRRTVYESIAEPLVSIGSVDDAEVEERVRAVAGRCRVGTELLSLFPRGLSEGQQQRVAIARALITNPRIVIADEIISALDASTRADILNLLGELQDERKMALLFIAHDLAAVGYLSQRIAVLYQGELVELAPTEELFEYPGHPYTRTLMPASSAIGARVMGPAAVSEWELPGVVKRVPGCGFHPRCPLVQTRCQLVEPELRAVGSESGLESHRVKCHLATDRSDAGGVGQGQTGTDPVAG